MLFDIGDEDDTACYHREEMNAEWCLYGVLNTGNFYFAVGLQPLQEITNLPYPLHPTISLHTTCFTICNYSEYTNIQYLLLK